MSTEIELKYLIDGGDVVGQFTQLLNQHQFTYKQAARQLSNTYFDTTDRMLRQYDFGLRVRKADDYTEQTIKTAGIVVGGLHQRPEYNVAIDASTPNLALFPADIWPATADVEQLQANLNAIFSTDFHRTTWLVNVGESVVEVAFDHGIIESKSHSKGQSESQSKGQTLPINEIELELVSGERQAIFTLAKALCQAFHVTPGRQSKAARGYQLWQGAINSPATDEISFQVPLNPELSVEKAMVLGFEHGLTCLQKAIEQSIAETELTHVKQVYEALSFIQQGLYLHQNLIESTTFKSA